MKSLLRVKKYRENVIEERAREREREKQRQRENNRSGRNCMTIDVGYHFLKTVLYEKSRSQNAFPQDRSLSVTVQKHII